MYIYYKIFEYFKIKQFYTNIYQIKYKNFKKKIKNSLIKLYKKLSPVKTFYVLRLKKNLLQKQIKILK